MIERRIRGWSLGFAFQSQGDLQNLLAPPAKQRKRPVRWNGLQFFRVGKIVRELRARLCFAVQHFRIDHAVRDEELAQLAGEIRVFGEAFHQDLARSIERRFRVGCARVLAVVGLEGFLQELCGFGFRRKRRVAQ